MYAAGHVGLALLGCAPLTYWWLRAGRPRQAVVVVAISLLFATSPDVDLHVAELTHRGLTHTVWAALAVGWLTTIAGEVVARAATSRSEGRWWWPLSATAASGGWAGGATVVVHLLGDVLTPMGVRPFAPFVGVEYSLALVAARDPTANRVLFVAGVLTMTIALLGGFTRGGRGHRTALGTSRRRHERDGGSRQRTHTATASPPPTER